MTRCQQILLVHTQLFVSLNDRWYFERFSKFQNSIQGFSNRDIIFFFSFFFVDPSQELIMFSRSGVGNICLNRTYPLLIFGLKAFKPFIRNQAIEVLTDYI